MFADFTPGVLNRPYFSSESNASMVLSSPDRIPRTVIREFGSRRTPPGWAFACPLKAEPLGDAGGTPQTVARSEICNKQEFGFQNFEFQVLSFDI